jgi:hypothetical protein
MVCSARAFGVVGRHFAALGGDEREPASVGGRDLPAARMLAEHRRALLGGLVLVDHGDKRPDSNDLVLVLGEGMGGEQHQGTRQDRAHGSFLWRIGEHSAIPRPSALFSR